MGKSRQTFLWKAEDPSSSLMSFVFGTMHVQDQRVFENLDRVQACIWDCDVFATEFNLDEANFLSLAMNVSLPENQRLTDLIPPKKYVKVRQILLKSFQVDLDQFQQYKPIFVSNIIQQQVFSADMPSSLDEYLFKFAKEQGKILKGIETFREQVEVINQVPLEIQLKNLLDIARNPSTYRKSLRRMAERYERGDLHQIHQAARKSIGSLRKIMLINRNEIMAERMGEMAKENSCFFAIGAGHLLGQKGVLRLLKLQGFKLKPISIQPKPPI